MSSAPAETVIAGAGVIGLAIAARLSAEGQEVTLIDPSPPGMGASYGNAGTIADYAVSPVGTPDVLKNLPSLLFNRNSPLAIRHSALLSLSPWLMRFAAQSLPGPAARNARAIAALLEGANPFWRDLAAGVGASDLLQPRGCLYLWRSPAQLASAAREREAKAALGVVSELLDAAALARLEPGLPPVAGATWFPQAIFLKDPGLMMRKIAEHLAPRCQFLTAKVTKITRSEGGVSLETEDAEGLRRSLGARRLIIACGAHSRPLALQAGDRIPLETERGYHVEWDMPELPLTRPACVTDRGFYLCPMRGRLRAAGTVELGGLSPRPSAHRIARLVAGARQIFPDLAEEPSRSWLGFRPSLPDSLPVIGPSRAGPEVLYAFGHGHIGVTLAPVTAGLISRMIAGEDPGAAAGAASPLRFARRSA